jgi:hypothetical protein
MKNGMLESVIENWLTNTDERGYQAPFCQLLTLKGYKVVHVSTHGPFEQGKDIIAIDSAGIPCAFQLKAGDISLSRWREIRPEVEELLDVPINHPSIDKTVPHKSYFITTGNFSDPVRREIDDRNEQRRKDKKSVLYTTVKGELLQDFLSAGSKFLPKEITDIELFLNLYSYDGANPFPKERFVKILSTVSPLSRECDKGVLVRSAASNLIFSAYLLSPYERAKNYWSLSDGWIINAAYLLALAEKYNAYEELHPTINLAIASAERSLAALQKESLESQDLIQNGLFDGMFYPFRATILCGYLSAYRLYLLLKGMEDWYDDQVISFFEAYEKDLKLFGEGAIPFLLSSFWYLLKTGNKEKAHKSLIKLIEAIIYANRKQKTGLINPYYEIEVAIQHYMGLLNEPITESFADKSYFLDSLISLAAKYGLREFLDSQWRGISHIELSEFKPKFSWETFLYRAEHGLLESRFPNQTQSWAKLVEEANKVDGHEIPQGFVKYPEFAILLFLAFPHRMRPVYVKFLDEAIAKA